MHFHVLQKCADDSVSDKESFPTFARTFPPVASVTKSIVALLKYYNWTKFSVVVCDKDHQQEIYKSLDLAASRNNMTINDVFQYEEPFKGGQDKYPFLEPNPFPAIVDDSAPKTRGRRS